MENIQKVRDFLIRKNVSLDVVILKAGLQYTGAFYPKVSKQGVELTFAVNHLAHFYLVNILIELINNKNEVLDIFYFFKNFFNFRIYN